MPIISALKHIIPACREGGTTLGDALELTFDDIANAPVADASSVSDWNIYFNLPTHGTPFTSVVVDGNIVKLYGGSGITLRDEIFTTLTAMPMPSYYLISIIDYCGCIIATDSTICVEQHNMVLVYLPSLIYMGYGCFSTCKSIETIYLPSCINFGSTVGFDVIFTISGRSITLTIPATLMTCNSGSPDGDIAYLQANNTVTIVQV